MPAVSIIIPVYNSAEFLEETLEKVCGQGLKDLEIICVDDNSQDDSRDILTRWAQKESRIKTVFLEKNVGPGGARNAGLDLATGEYVAFLDADDWPESEFFYEKLYYRARWVEADFAKGNYWFSDRTRVDASKNELIRQDRRYFTSDFCCAIFRKGLIEELNLRFPLLRDMEDPVFTLGFTLHSKKAVLIDECVLKIRRHSNSLTAGEPTVSKVGEKLSGLSMLLDKMNNDGGIPSKVYIYNFVFWLNMIVQNALVGGSQDIEEFIFSCWRAMKPRVKFLDQIQTRFEEVNPDLGAWLFGRPDLDSSSSSILPHLISAHAVSFDLFDTLILRPYVNPTDVFADLERIWKTPGFACLRVEAEKRAREEKTASGGEEITLAEIYALMPEEYAEYMELEIAYEIDIARPNPEIMNFSGLARLPRKKMIVTTDTYLPESAIKAILAKTGMSFDKIYVSSEIGKRKKTGTLYQHILQDLSIDPTKIVHIGDNWASDAEAAWAQGIKAYWHRSPTDRYMESLGAAGERERLRRFLPELVSGLAMLNWARPNRSTFFNLGFMYAGPLAVSFCQALRAYTQARGLKKILFAARDGYLLKKIYALLYPETKKDLVLVAANRILANKYMDAPRDCAYGQYLASLAGEGERICLVDGGTRNFTAQKLIGKFTGAQVYGVYLTCPVDLTLDYINLSEEGFHALKELFGWDTAEWLLSAPWPPIIDVVDGKWVFAEAGPDELERMGLYRRTVAGALSFALDFAGFFGKSGLIIRLPDIFLMLGDFMKNPTFTDKWRQLRMKHAFDMLHENYQSLYDLCNQNGEKQ